MKLPDEMRESDEGIAEKFARLVAWTSTLRDTSVLAEVSNGYVTLTGEVDHPYQKQVAANRVGELDGVIAVTNDIKVRARPSDVQASDILRQSDARWHDPDVRRAGARRGGGVGYHGSQADRQSAARRLSALVGSVLGPGTRRRWRS